MPHNRRISVTGLGYVGLPVAAAFGRATAVLGFDRDAGRIDELQRGIDRSGEVSGADLAGLDITFTTDATLLGQADFHIVTVPTPLDGNNQPDLGPLLSATATIAAQLKPGDFVVFESTVYPGATEEECIPVLESGSGLRAGEDFSVGYSPERINPGDLAHRFENITKVVSAQDGQGLDVIAAVYESAVTAGVYRAASIRVAEAAKVIENTQRDLNIALINELVMIFEKLGLDTADVLETAATKWNFLPFKPGLVGGHCIGVDPWYLTWKARQAGYTPRVILSGREINDAMGRYVAGRVITALSQGGKKPAECSVIILGVTFKENVPDTRNSRVPDIAGELGQHGVSVQIHDPVAAGESAGVPGHTAEHDLASLRPADAVILAVAHDDYIQGGWHMVQGLLQEKTGLVFDVKSVLDRGQTPQGVTLLRL